MSEYGGGRRLPATPVALEAMIRERNSHLSATVEELVARTKPAVLVESAKNDVKRSLFNATHTPDGALNTQKVAAIGAVVLGVVSMMVTARVRTRRRRRMGCTCHGG